MNFRRRKLIHVTTLMHFDHPVSTDAPGMFVLRAESDLWGSVLQDTVGDKDMNESAELRFASGMHPRYQLQKRVVVSDVTQPRCEADVVGVATVDLPMADNRRLATVSVVVDWARRGSGIGTALHAAALSVARAHGRSTIQSWTWESRLVPEGALTLAASEGRIDATSPSSRALTKWGYALGQVERLSRLTLPDAQEATARREEVVTGKPKDYEVITLKDNIPDRLLSGVAELCEAMSSDVPTGGMDVERESWDAGRVRATMDEALAARREQLLTLIRHIPTQQVVAFTRIFRDASSPQVAHQWETLVLQGHRGHRLGILMKIVNQATAVEVWPTARRLITGNASENSHMLTINDALGYESYAASGFWELRTRGTDG